MQGSPPSPSKQGGNVYTSLGSDMTAVSSHANENGFKISTGDHGRRASGQSVSSQSIQENKLTVPVLPLEYQKPLHLTSAFQSNDDLQGNTHAPASEQNRVQFATYRSDKSDVPRLGAPPGADADQLKPWVPIPLRPYFWIPLVIFLVGCAIGLEVALHFSNKNQGWPFKDSTNSFIAFHYAYTLPPVIIAATVVAMWAWTDIEIKKLQPYVDLVHGDSPPHRSLLLDYTRHNNFLVWTRAAYNRHYLVALASLMVLLTLSFQPLAAALLVVKNIWIQVPDVTSINLAAVGLNQNLQFNDLTSFLTGAGYAGASVLYDLPPPPFIHVPYTVAPFQLPIAVTSNGTAFVNTTAIKSETGCQSVAVQMTQTTAGAWTNTASSNGCSISWNVVNTTNTLFGVELPTCGSPSPPQFSPVVFWFFSYVPTAQASATFCTPSILLFEVNAAVDIRTGNITAISEIRPFSASSNFSAFSANVTGPPLNGRAYNGIQFNLTNPDKFVLGRQNATQLQLPASIYQAAVQSPQGFVGSFANNTLATLADQVYGLYLTLVAREVYFLGDDEDINVQIKTFQQRLFLSDVAVHLLAAAMLILAVFGTIVHIFHIEDRRFLRLQHEPGTIASAVSIGAQTGVGEVLAGRQDEDDIKKALRNKKFRIDPATMKIIMEGEDGYETAAVPTSPMYRRKSVLELLQRTPRRPHKASPSASAPPSPSSPKETLKST